MTKIAHKGVFPVVHSETQVRFICSLSMSSSESAITMGHLSVALCVFFFLSVGVSLTSVNASNEFNLATLLSLERNLTAYLSTVYTGSALANEQIVTIEECLYSRKWTMYSKHICFTLHTFKGNKRTPKAADAALVRAFRLYVTLESFEKKQLKECYLKSFNYNICIGAYAFKLRKKFALTVRQKTRLHDYWNKFLFEDSDFVYHCFTFHQRDTFAGCKGISWNRTKIIAEINPNRNEASKLRSFKNAHALHLQALWTKLEAKRHSQYWAFRLTGQHELAQVFYCALNLEWRPNVDHICQIITNNSAAIPEYRSSESIAKYRTLYQKHLYDEKMHDCYMYHRFDRYSGCLKFKLNDTSYQVSRKASFELEASS